MNDTLCFDSTDNDDRRRSALYDGQLYVFSPTKSTRALCSHAKTMIEDAFGDCEPRKAQYEMPVEAYVDIVAPLKPRFIHHPLTKRLIVEILREKGCDPERTYFDVPRLRMVTSDGYLTSGVGYAHHPHRDTWYSAPMCQLNWWLPIYDIDSSSTMAFHPAYWSRPLENSSSTFNYYEWNSKGRRQAATQIRKDNRKQPKATEPIETGAEFRVVVPAGGLVLFSAAHLHSTVPNTSGSTRYSIDFRTANKHDLQVGLGAPNIDSAPSGTALRDFMRMSDHERLPESLVARFDSGPRDAGDLIFRPDPPDGA